MEILFAILRILFFPGLLFVAVGLSEDDANGIIDSYPTVEIPCVPITEYT